MLGIAISIAPCLDDVDVRRHLFNQAMEEECKKFNFLFFDIENCINFTTRQAGSSRDSIHMSEDVALPSLVEGLKEFLCTASQRVVEPAIKTVQKCPEWLWRELKQHNVKGKIFFLLEVSLVISHVQTMELHKRHMTL